MNIDFEKASFKDFENMPGLGPHEWARHFDAYLEDLGKRGHMNYRLEGFTGSGPEMELRLPGNPLRNFVSLVSN
ncbi:MAG: 2-amino-3-ketobutyrate CoA ligase, partial [Chitinophagaceae bacterium]|nr:2-amino-3-ketobutyrate CoA ligase [Chitinophagaceae bacterium]